MDDLISRKAAIDQTMGKLDYTDVLFDTATESEIVYMLRSLPSVPAVPLDKLCEWLAERYAVPCRAFDEPEKLFCGQCYEEGISNVECWKRYMIKWMEGLDAAD